jgi:hypothetical protein
MNSKKNLVGRRAALQTLALASVVPTALGQTGSKSRGIHVDA